MSLMSRVKRMLSDAEKLTKKVTMVFVKDASVLTDEQLADASTIYLYLEI